MIAARPVTQTIALGAMLAATVGPAAGQSPRKMHFRVLNTLVDVAAALETCWLANEPPLAQSRPGMNVTVMLNFTRTGEIFGEPRFTTEQGLLSENAFKIREQS